MDHYYNQYNGLVNHKTYIWSKTHKFYADASAKFFRVPRKKECLWCNKKF